MILSTSDSLASDLEDSDRSSAIGIVILAAGASTRMGQPKQLLPYQERHLLHHTVDVAISSGFEPIVVVLGAYADRIKSTIGQSLIPHRITSNIVR